jgi:hypothetical protein
MNTIDKLKAAHAAATPGEWVVEPRHSVFGSVGTVHGRMICLMYQQSGDEKTNAEFIALAHNHMPDLLEAVELLDVALHALETPGDFTEDELREQVVGDIARHLAKLKEAA